MLEPRPVAGGGGTLVYWNHDRNQNAAAGAAVLVPCHWIPPPTSQRIIIRHLEGYKLKGNIIKAEK